jgi:alcohol dehydrogenase class IV
MERFEFSTTDRIVFGLNTSEDVAEIAQGLGSRAFVVVGGTADRAEVILDGLSQRDIEYTVFPVRGEPSIEMVTEGVAQADEASCDLIISVGGGSVIDAGKAVAALVANGGQPLDYLEVVGLNKPLTRPSLPMVAVPTTAGAGAEVTRNAVLKVADEGVKVSLRSPYMLPTMAVVDPLLTISIPPNVTASTGLDALTQCLEPYVSAQANPLTDAISSAGLKRAARSLRKAYEDGTNVLARTDMSVASLFGGLALANAKLGAVHGFAGVLGGMYPAPHGMVCARLLPFVTDTNVKALESRQPDSPILERYAVVARLVTGNPAASAADGVTWIQDLCDALAVPGLAEFGVREDDFADIVAKSQKASSMRGNPLPLTDDELVAILQQAM